MPILPVGRRAHSSVAKRSSASGSPSTMMGYERSAGSFTIATSTRVLTARRFRLALAAPASRLVHPIDDRLDHRRRHEARGVDRDAGARIVRLALRHQPLD